MMPRPLFRNISAIKKQLPCFKAAVYLLDLPSRHLHKRVAPLLQRLFEPLADLFREAIPYRQIG